MSDGLYSINEKVFASRGPQPKTREPRLLRPRFRYRYVALFALIGLLPLRANHPVRWWAVGLCGLFLVVALLKSELLRPLNRVWTRLGLLMGRVVSPVITAILFYLVVTPTGLLFRLFGKDPLCLVFDPNVKSYWIERRPPGPPPETMTNQF